MISSVTFENYRGFTRYTLDGLSRVNLLVGKNNCGKTAILEGIHFMMSGGDPNVLFDSAFHRGEALIREDEFIDVEGVSRSERVATIPTVTHFFNGHRISPGQSFNIVSNEKAYGVSAQIVLQEKPENGQVLPQSYSEKAFWMLSIKSPTDDPSFRFHSIPITEEGTPIIDVLKLYRQMQSRNINGHGRSLTTPVVFLETESLKPSSISLMWDKATLEGREAEVITAMTLLEPRLTDIRFLTGGGRMPGRFSGILVELDHKRDERLPLGSFGDGMRRLLALAIAVIQSTNGVMLIDEIDTGLHYSVMSDLWRFVVEAAKQSNVQVFATTHSLDCIRGLAELYRQHPEYADDISLQRIDPRLEKSVAFKAKEIAIAIQHDMEVR